MDKLNRLFVSGGVISPNQLYSLCKTLLHHDINHISLGSRQDILIPLDVTALSETPEVENGVFSVQPYAQNNNLVSSYLASDIFDSYDWVKSSTYVFILESFDFVPTLKINITDPKQNLIPSFSGHINFLASEYLDYWHIYIRKEGNKNPNLYPVMIHSNHICRLSKMLAQYWEEFDRIDDLFTLISDAADLDTRVIKDKPTYDIKIFPYYEGMHRYDIDKFWLGLYWRNNKYDINFLLELCKVCQAQEISSICLSSWKSLIIRGIAKTNKIKWEKLLGSNGISVRHSQLEMNWHLPAGDNDSLALKNAIVEHLNKKDISTYGLTIGIYSILGQAFTSIALVKSDKDHRLRSVDIYHATNFNPDLCTYKMYAQNIGLQNIPDLLIELSQLYFARYLDRDEIETPDLPLAKASTEPLIELYQCKNCLNVIHLNEEHLSDEIESANCIVCESGFEDFIKTKIAVGTPLSYQTW